ncbi:putative trehalose-phosphate phosphatase D [Glycine soja]
MCTDMGCKLALEDKKRVAFRRRQRHEHVDATRHAKPCNCSSLASQQQKGHRTKEKLIQFLCSSCLLCVCYPLACVCCFIKLPCRICHQALRCAQKWACYGSKNNRAGFVNSLAFAKSGEFLVAGVGHVKIFSNCVLLTVVLKVVMSCQGCAGAVNRILGKMEGIFIPASYLYYHIQNENDLLWMSPPLFRHRHHRHCFALLRDQVRKRNIHHTYLDFVQCRAAFHFHHQDIQTRDMKKKATTEDVELLTKSWAALAEKVRLVLNEYPQLRLTQGRKVLEICLTIKWDNGKALEFLLESLGYENSNDVFPIYIGDDRTDEDAFRVTNVATHS